MPSQMLVDEPSFPQFVRAEEARADWRQIRIDAEVHAQQPHARFPQHVTEFTTEWQMSSTNEEVYSE